MGANEKHDATYHGGEYAPDYSYVKTIFVMNAKTPVSGGHPDTLWEDRTEQFDRWLESVRSEAKVAALNEAATAVMEERFDSETEVSNWLSDRALKVSAS